MPAIECNYSSVLKAAQREPVKKFQESQHPRDKVGKFTNSEFSGDFDIRAMNPKGQRFMIHPSSTKVFVGASDPSTDTGQQNYLTDPKHFEWVEAHNSHAVEFDDAQHRGVNLPGKYDDYIKGWVYGPDTVNQGPGDRGDYPAGRINFYSKYFEDSAKGYDAYVHAVEAFIASGHATAETRVEGLEACIGYGMSGKRTLGEAFPFLFEKKHRKAAGEYGWVLKGGPGSGRYPKGSGGEATKGRAFTSDEGYQWHETGPAAEWAKNLPYEDHQALSNYSGFGYHDVNDQLRGTFTPHIISEFVREATPEEAATKFQVNAEYLAKFPHPFGRDITKFTPEDPYNRILDAEGNYVGHMEHNVFYKPVEGGPVVEWSVQRAAPDLKYVEELKQKAAKLNDLIANRGLVLTETITVERGAYLPGVTFQQLQDMVYEGPNGEPPAILTEKGFTSTMLGDAEGRARGYPALGKWESLYNRFGAPLSAHEDEVGEAIRFHIVLPAGTKVASIEASRRLEFEFPRVPDPNPRPPDIAEEYWTMRDYKAKPTVNTARWADKNTRSESEILLGSGARFRVVRVQPGEMQQSGDSSVKPVQVREMWLEYIGGGSSEGTVKKIDFSRILKGGPGSGRYPKGSGGEDTGSSDVISDPTLAAQAVVGIAAVEKLLDTAIKTADYTEIPHTPQSWEEVEQATKEKVFQKYKQQFIDIDVDTTELVEAVDADLNENNGAIIDVAMARTLDEIGNHPFFDKKLDPDTFEIAEDFHDGTNPTLNYARIRTMAPDGKPVELEAVHPGEPISESGQTIIEHIWDKQYKQAFEEARDAKWEAPAYIAATKALQDEVVTDQWNAMDEAQHFDYMNDWDLATPVAKELVEGPPANWTTGIGDSSDQYAQTRDSVDYERTHAIANRLTELRTDELRKERDVDRVKPYDVVKNPGGPGFTIYNADGDPATLKTFATEAEAGFFAADLRERMSKVSLGIPSKDLIDRVWSDWKGSSSGPTAQALQLAAARELGGHHRLTDDEVKNAVWAANQLVTGTGSDKDTQGMATLQAYVRAQWEVSQTVMAKSGHDHVEVYRALMLEGELVNAAAHEYRDSLGHVLPVTGVEVTPLYREPPPFTVEDHTHSPSQPNFVVTGKTTGGLSSVAASNTLEQATINAKSWQSEEFQKRILTFTFNNEAYSVRLDGEDSVGAAIADRVKRSLGNSVRAQLTDLALQRAGAQSTTGTLGVANHWNGVGSNPTDSARVVLRIAAPATSILSLPVFGQNAQEEHETVLIGTKDKWVWDAWEFNAPSFKDHPLVQRAVKIERQRLVVDLQAEDRGKPHWLSQTDFSSPLTKALKGGPGSGRYPKGSGRNQAQIIAQLTADPTKIYPVDSFTEARFILPDGTRLGHKYFTHAEATIAVGLVLPDVLSQGVLRWANGAETYSPITEAQAQRLYDSTYDGKSTLYVDAFESEAPGKSGSHSYDNKIFEGHFTADSIRHWINGHYGPDGSFSKERKAACDFSTVLKGGPGSGRYPKGSGPQSEDHPIVARFRALKAPDAEFPALAVTDDYNSTKFILPDGTRLAHGFDTHEAAATTLDVDLWDAMRAGIMRYSPGMGAEIGAPITEIQAQRLIDGSLTVGDHSLYLDVFYGKIRGSKHFDIERVTADGIRSWVNNHFVKTAIDCSYVTVLKGGPGSGRYPKGSGVQSIAPAFNIYRTSEDVVKVKSWGEEFSYQWKDSPGHLLTGQPIARADIPDVLYHVTTNAPAVALTGALLGQHKDAGLGGGQESGVSFTTSLEDAHVIERELIRAIEIARGEVDIDAMDRYAREDEASAGLPAGTLNRAVAFSKESWNVDAPNIGKTHVWDETKPEGERYTEGPPATPVEAERVRRSLLKDALNAYLIARDGDVGKAHPFLKNPILFGRQEQLQKIRTTDVKILEVASSQIPETALVTTGSDAFLHEVRVYSDVPIKKRVQKGGPGSGRYPKGSGETGIINTLTQHMKKLPSLLALPRVQFITPDGNMYRGPSGASHEVSAASIGFSLHDILQTGVIRVIVHGSVVQGFSVGAPITSMQADLIAGHATEGLRVDVLVKGVKPEWVAPPDALDTGWVNWSSKQFDQRHATSDAVRRWVNGHFEKRAIDCQYTSVLKGGPNSGRYPKGSGKQLQGDEEDNALAARTFLHGTAAANLDTILKEGLTVAHAGQVWPDFSLKDQVYLTSSEDDAVTWAENAVKEYRKDLINTGVKDVLSGQNTAAIDVVLANVRARADRKIAVLTVRIPEDRLADLKQDIHFETEGNKQFKGNIPASWIIEAKILSERFADTDWINVPLPKAASDGQLVYIAVVLDEKPMGIFAQVLKGQSVVPSLYAQVLKGGPGSGRYPKGSGGFHEKAPKDWSGWHPNQLAIALVASGAVGADGKAKIPEPNASPLKSGHVKTVHHGELTGGVNKSMLVELEDGTQAVYKPEIGEAWNLSFSNSDINRYIKNKNLSLAEREAMAYEVDQLLGTNLVPETVLRETLDVEVEARDDDGGDYDDDGGGGYDYYQLQQMYEEYKEKNQDQVYDIVGEQMNNMFSEAQDEHVKDITSRVEEVQEIWDEIVAEDPDLQIYGSKTALIGHPVLPMGSKKPFERAWDEQAVDPLEVLDEAKVDVSSGMSDGEKGTVKAILTRMRGEKYTSIGELDEDKARDHLDRDQWIEDHADTEARLMDEQVQSFSDWKNAHGYENSEGGGGGGGGGGGRSQNNQAPHPTGGSLQRFMEHLSPFGDMDVKERRKFAVLDYALGTMDRHGGNIMFQGNKPIAIDNGYSMPGSPTPDGFTFRSEPVVSWKSRPQSVPAEARTELLERLQTVDWPAFVAKHPRMDSREQNAFLGRIAKLKTAMQTEEGLYELWSDQELMR